MCCSDTDTFSCHLQLWLKNRRTHPTNSPASSFKIHPASFGQLENVQTSCMCILTLKRNIIWIKTDLTGTSNDTDAPYGIYFCLLPHSGQLPPLEAASLFSSDRLVESHKALLIDSLVLCSTALWQDAEAPCSDFKCQLLLKLEGKTEN